MLVWLTSWQLAEGHMRITVGDTVDWILYPADKDWISRLFAKRLTIDWQLDAYGGAVDQPARHVFGKVAALSRVRCRQVRTDGGVLPARGEASLHDASDTTSSWPPDNPLTLMDASAHPDRAAAVTGSFISALTNPDTDGEYGYVLSLEVTDDWIASRTAPQT